MKRPKTGRQRDAELPVARQEQAQVFGVVEFSLGSPVQMIDFLSTWGLSSPRVPVDEALQHSHIRTDPHTVVPIPQHRQWTKGVMGVLGQKEIVDGLLLVVPQLEIPEDDYISATLEVDVWWLLRGAALGWPVKDCHTTENAVLSSVPNNIGNTFRVQVVAEVGAMIE